MCRSYKNLFLICVWRGLLLRHNLNLSITYWIERDYPVFSDQRVLTRIWGPAESTPKMTTPAADYSCISTRDVRMLRHPPSSERVITKMNINTLTCLCEKDQVVKP